jgi:hypothetical protein
MIFSSCLDKDPENVYNQDDVDYTNTAAMFGPVAGIYSKAVTENGFSRWAMLGLIAIRSDDTDKGSSATDQADFNYAKNFQYAELREYWALNASWEGLYNLVLTSNANLAILKKYTPYLTKEEDKVLNLQYQAEVRFMRANAYFYLTRMWGDVTLITNNDQLSKNPTLDKRQQVYDFINTELDTCAMHLPALRPNEMPNKGQVTKYTALALKAKANADINNWDAVLDATNQIVESGKFELYPDFYQSFKKPGRLSNESLFELQYSDLKDPVYRSDNWFAFQGPNNLKGKNNATMGGGWGFMTPSQKIVDLFVARGETVRYTTTFLFSNSITASGDTIGNNTAKVYNGKLYLPSDQLTPTRTDYGSGNNIRMIRYADILLLNAEAKVRKGQNGDAPFNLVRKRAQMPIITNVTLDQILEERQVELACEWGERFFDLVRTGKAQGTLPNFVTGASEFYPIPQAQINLNPGYQ